MSVPNGRTWTWLDMEGFALNNVGCCEGRLITW